MIKNDMDDDNEIVIFGGPFHEYLKSIGKNDFVNKIEQLESRSADRYKTVFGCYLFLCKSAFYQWVFSLLGAMERPVIYAIFEKFATSPLIDQIDELLITEEIVTFERKSFTFPSIISTISLLILVPILCLIVALYSTAYIIRYSILLLALFPILFVSFLLGKRFFLLRIQNRFSHFINGQQKFDSDFRKSVRFIRDRELIVFGLMAKIAAKQHQSSLMKLCFGAIRKTLILILTSLISALRFETKRLSEKVCTISECRNLTCNFQSPEIESLTKLGDEIPLDLDSIKAIWQLYYVHRSEYLRCLVYCLLRNGPNSAAKSLFSLKCSQEWGEIKEMGKVERMSKLREMDRFIDDKVDLLSNSLNSDRKKSLLSIRNRLVFAWERISHLSSTPDSPNFHSELLFVTSAVDEISGHLFDLIPGTNHVLHNHPCSKPVGIDPELSPVDVDEKVDVTDRFDVDDQNFLQVFEAIAEWQNDDDNGKNHWENDNTIDKSSTMNLINELKLKLVDRSERMHQRELLALARFRNVPLEQLIREEKPDEELDEKPKELNPNQHLFDQNEHKSNFTSDLHTEIAVQMRRRFVQKKKTDEDVVGDSDSSAD